MPALSARWRRRCAANRKRPKAIRSTLEKELIEPDVKTAFDVFGSDLPDDAFTGVFDQPRQQRWRKVNL